MDKHQNQDPFSAGSYQRNLEQMFLAIASANLHSRFYIEIQNVLVRVQIWFWSWTLPEVSTKRTSGGS